MNTVRDEFPALWQFLGGYLHQDWRHEYASPEAAFRDFLDGEPGLAEETAAELTAVLASGRDEDDLKSLVLEGGSFYLPSNDGIAPSAWLARLLSMCPGATDE
jgi:hypothetical protein